MTSMDNISLGELERDALTELVNIGVGRAATSLRKMVGKHILLSVPAVEVVTLAAASRLLVERETDKLVAIRQEFSGFFSGRALLIFPQSNSLDLVRAVVSGDLSVAELVELERDALAETGNIILNGCLGSMANMLREPLVMSLPEVLYGDGNDLFYAGRDAREGTVLFLYINFVIEERNIRGYIAMMMDLPSMMSLKALISEFIARVTGDDRVGDDRTGAASGA
jgi:chemotaxis protein CheC